MATAVATALHAQPLRVGADCNTHHCDAALGEAAANSAQFALRDFRRITSESGDTRHLSGMYTATARAADVADEHE
jgi:hypothetical protein